MAYRDKRLAVAAVVLALAGACWTVLTAQQPAATITLDPATRFQTISGWETTAYSAQADPAFPRYKDALFDQAIGDLGLTRVRLEVRSGSENSQASWLAYRQGALSNQLWRCYRYSTVNDNGDPQAIAAAGYHFDEMDFDVEQVVLPLKQRMEARGQKLHVNLTYVSFTPQMKEAGCPAGLQNHHAGDPEEYAEFVLATYRHLRTKYGLTPDTWEMILEPDNTTDWRGAQIGAAMAAAGRRLTANGFTPRFVAPSNTDAAAAVVYFDQMVQVPGVPGFLSEFCYHRYRGVSDSVLQAIRDRGVQYGVRTAMLEHIGSGHEDLHQDLVQGRNSSWSQFTLAGIGMNDDGGAYYRIDVSNPQAPQVIPGWRTKYLRQYFRYVRPGAVRFAATTVGNSFDAVAFQNPDGKAVAVVMTPLGGSLTLNGLPAGAYGIRYTTSNVSDFELPDATVQSGQALQTGIPGPGVITIFGKAPAAGGTRPSVAAITNAASYATGSVAPGEIVTVFGTNLGPTTLVTLRLDNGGRVSASLDGTSLLFDGIAAPMVYAQANQLSAVAPFSVAGRTSTVVQAQRGGQLSTGVTLAVSPALPGLFSLDASGRGPGAIVNQNGSVNTAFNPATRGTVVSLYGTGEGQSDPPGTDGVVEGSSLRRPRLPVTARIAGVPATVEYAGSAPGLVAGVLQINVRIPPGVTAGTLPVEIAVGGIAGQQGVTIFVR